MNWHTTRQQLSMGSLPYIMAIVNLTPDSFSDGGRYTSRQNALDLIDACLSLGVQIIDVGGQSTRPGAQIIPAKEEWDRIKMLLSEIISIAKDRALVSVDTFYGYVAAKALDMGVDIINDVSGGDWVADHTWPVIAAHARCGYILTHSQGPPDIMQRNPSYQNIIQEILQYFTQKIQELEALGIAQQRIVIDPGIGFGKTTSHNLEILRHLSQFKKFQRPILISLSRKRLIRDILQMPPILDPHDSTSIQTLDRATNLLNLIATQNGANIWRVHNTAQALQTIQLWKAYKNMQTQEPQTPQI
jgi:dihydropteroate synthase